MNVVILGCGRVGSTLAVSLDRSGHQVTVIDRLEYQFSRLGPGFSGRTVLGTGIDEDLLRLAGIEQADAFVATTNGDNTALMAAQIAKEIFHVPHVVARIYDPVRQQLYKDLGLDTVSPTTTMAGIIEERITGTLTSESAAGS